MNQLVCWKCGETLDYLSEPLSRRDVCRACGVELHVCRMCRFYDTSRSKSCYEPVAEEVKEKERANFCDYFKPGENAFDSESGKRSQAAREELDALFGGAVTQAEKEAADDSARALEDLFRKTDDPE